MNITKGLTNTVEIITDSSTSANQVKSGSLSVLATPVMCALMEQAASELCEKYMDEKSTTVGTQLCVEHLAATAQGVRVKAEAVVTEVDERKISFSVAAYDNAGLIGKGTHTRFVVFKDRFITKAEKRKEIRND